MKPPLPATPDDIPASNICSHPLSSEELRDIQSLIGIAKSSSSNTSSNSNNGDVAASQHPLTGRRVMVPMTSKAFLEGTLQPEIKASNTTEAMNEQLFINDGGKLVQMSRADAANFFDKRQNKLSSTVKKPPNSATKATPKKSALKSSKIKSSGGIDTKAPHQSSSAEPMLPLMEIRETCDVSGNILNSEVVNMSNTMKRLGDGLNNVPNVGDGGDDGKKLGQLLAQTLKAGEDDITKDVHASYQNVAEEGNKPEQSSEVKTKTKKTISDSEYDQIYSRLEELERLEEEDAKSKRVNAKSSKRLQSSGWSKGFLNTKTTKTKKKSNAPTRGKVSIKQKETLNCAESADAPKPVPVASSPDKALRVSFSNNTTAIPKMESNADIPTDKTSKVSFSSDDDIKEIPRIGQSKVPPRPPAGRPVSFNRTNNNYVEEEVPEMDPFAPKSTVPFEENVFRGVVKERNVSMGRDDVKYKGGNTGGKKKLSRFAQQRLQRE